MHKKQLGYWLKAIVTSFRVLPIWAHTMRVNTFFLGVEVNEFGKYRHNAYDQYSFVGIWNEPTGDGPTVVTAFLCATDRKMSPVCEKYATA